jgi:hypothetical protein
MGKKMLKIATLSGLALLTFVHSASAGCREDIQAMLKAVEKATNYRIVTKTIMAGSVVQHTEQHFLDYSHFYQRIEESRVHWLVLGNQEYMSSDGKNWKPWQTRDAGWLEKDLARNVELRNAVENVACGTEEVEGVLYRKFQYAQKSEKPMPTVSEIVTYLDLRSGRPAMRIINSVSGGQQFKTTASFRWDEQVVLPSP